MPDYYIGRQAIFNKSKNVVAYELLYRSDNANVATISNPDLATSQVILNSYLETGISKLAGNHQTFINMTQHFIHHKELLPPPDNQLVLEIVEDIAVTEDLIAAITDLKQHGYKIALDDFRYDKSLIDLIELADIIKVDILDLSLIDIELEYNKLRAFDKTLLAEKIETHAR